LPIPKDGRSGGESLETVIAHLGLEEVFPPERIERLLGIVERYQAEVDRRVDALVPKFPRDYWWNSADDMQVKMDATRNGFGDALADLGCEDDVCALGADITSSIRMDRFYKPDGKTDDRGGDDDDSRRGARQRGARAVRRLLRRVFDRA